MGHSHQSPFWLSRWQSATATMKRDGEEDWEESKKKLWRWTYAHGSVWETTWTKTFSWSWRPEDGKAGDNTEAISRGSSNTYGSKGSGSGKQGSKDGGKEGGKEGGRGQQCQCQQQGGSGKEGDKGGGGGTGGSYGKSYQSGGGWH